MHSTLGRVLIGVLLAQGLFYALRHLSTGIVLLFQGQEESASTWDSFHGLLLLQGLLLLAPALGGVLAGSSRRGGWLLGACVGAFHGASALILSPVPGQSISSVTQYGLPLLQTLFGALGGLVGSSIWKPVQALTFLRVDKKPGIASPRRVPLFTGPIAWVRVTIGTGIAIAGSLYAARLFDLVLMAGEFRSSHLMQDQIVTWEIKAFAILFGAAIAGASTFNGLKQVCASASSHLLPHRHHDVRPSNADGLRTDAGQHDVAQSVGWLLRLPTLPPVFKRSRSLDTPY